MKQTKIIAVLALAFILGIAAPMAGIMVANHVSAAEEATQGTIEVQDATAFANAANDSSISEITLLSNINLASVIKIDRTTPLTIKLNGNNITNPTGHGLQINHGNVTITGTGEIYGQSSGSAINILGSSTLANNYTVVTIDSGVTLKSDAMYGIAIVDSNQNGKAYGVVVNLNGTIVSPFGITINGRINDTTSAPTININDGAVINTTSKEASLPIYAAGYANWKVGAATITSKAAVAMKAGQATFTGTNITVDGTLTSADPTNNGVNPTNAVFHVEHNNSYAGNVGITVNSGTYTSKNGNVFYEYNLNATAQSPADININGGTFTAAAGSQAIFGGDEAATDIYITGGTFSGTDVADFKTNGYLANGLTIDTNGAVVASIPSFSSSSANNTPIATTLKSNNGEVTVSGDLGAAVTLEAKPVEKQIAAFNNRKTALYDIRLLDAKGIAVQPDGSVLVSIEVPSVLDGAKSHVYYVNEAGAIEALESQYSAGIISFYTTHFSLYAIVEGDVITASAPSAQVPDTGNISSQGIITAISTTIPLLILAGLAFIWFNRHMVKVRRAERLAEEERERIAKAYIPKAHREATIDRFVATPVEHKNPTGPIVDTFVK